MLTNVRSSVNHQQRNFPGPSSRNISCANRLPTRHPAHVTDDVPDPEASGTPDEPDEPDEPDDSMTRFVRSLVAYVVLAGLSWLGVAFVHQRVVHGALKAAAVLFSILAAWCLGWMLVMVLMAMRSVNRRRTEERQFGEFEREWGDPDEPFDPNPPFDPDEPFDPELGH